jgi:hypothetical protein
MLARASCASILVWNDTWVEGASIFDGVMKALRP